MPKSVSTGSPAKKGGSDSDSKKYRESSEKENDTHLTDDGRTPVEPNYGCKPVEKLYLETGDVLEHFGSLTQAAKSVGVSQSCISNAASGYKGTKSSAGFGWRFSNSRTSVIEPPSTQADICRKPVVEHNNGRKSVEKFCLETGDVLGYFGSLREAAKSVGVTRYAIRNAVNGFKGAKSSAGFGWRFFNSRTSVLDPASTPTDTSVPAQTKSQGSIASKKAKSCLKPWKIQGKFQAVTVAKSVGVSKPAVTFALTKIALTDASVPSLADSQKSIQTTSNILSSSVVSRKGYGSTLDQDHQHQSYKENTTNPLSSTNNKLHKPVEKICLETGKVLEFFSSAIEATKSVAISQAAISLALTHYKRRGSAAGFGWRYADSGVTEAASALADKVYSERLQVDEPTGTCYDDLNDIISISSSSSNDEDTMDMQSDIDICTTDRSPKRIKVTANGERGPSDLPSGDDALDGSSSGDDAGCTVKAESNARKYVRVEGSTALPSHLEEPKNPANVLLGNTQKSPHTPQLVETSTHCTSSPPGTSGAKPVEKMCLQTGKVVEKFRSVTEAAQSVGVSPATLNTAAIRYHGIKFCAGFGWRFADSKKEAPTHLGSTAPAEALPRNDVISVPAGAAKSRGAHKRRVEKICLKTGQVLGDFGSVKEAAASVGVSKSGISNVLNGYRQGSITSCAGFGWRYTNSRTTSKPTKQVSTGSQPRSTVASKLPPNMKMPTKTQKEVRAPSDLLAGDEALHESSPDDDDSFFAVKGEYNARKYARPSTSRPLTSGNASRRGRKGTKIEQVCLQTGKLLQRFDSISEAAKVTGFVYAHIRESMGQVSNGFFWRFEGSTALPSHMDESSLANVLLGTTQKFPHNAHLVEKSTHFTSSPSVVPTPPVSASTGKLVEKYCVKTGRLLARFGSIVEAALSVGVAPANIMAVVSSLKTSKICMGFGWRYAVSAEPPPEASVVGPSHVTGVASCGTYTPRQGDRFRIYFDKVTDVFGARHEAAGWYAGTATEVVPCYDRQCLVYLSFDDQVDAVFEFPAPDIQRILPSQSGKPSNKVFAVDGAGALQLAYECSPIRIDVGDVVCYKYPSSDKAEGQWHRGRVAISHENGTCDVVFDADVRDCNLEKSRFRLMERGSEAKGWFVGLTIRHREKVASARISRIADDDRVVLTFPDGSEASQGYDEVATTLMKETLETVKARTSK